jgi:hypothetical protein
MTGTFALRFLETNLSMARHQTSCGFLPGRRVGFEGANPSISSSRKAAATATCISHDTSRDEGDHPRANMTCLVVTLLP